MTVGGIDASEEFAGRVASGEPGGLVLVETTDYHDQAHLVRDAENDGLLMPAGRVRGDRKRPRLYPRNQTIEPTVFGPDGRERRRRDGRRLGGPGGCVRLGVDSMFDSLYERQIAMDHEHGRVGGVSARGGGHRETLGEMRERAMRTAGAGVARAVVDRNHAAYRVMSVQRLVGEYERRGMVGDGDVRRVRMAMQEAR